MGIRINILEQGRGVEVLAEGVVRGQDIIDAHKIIYDERYLKRQRYQIIDRYRPWRAKRRPVVPGSREARLDTRRAEGAKGDPKIASERGVQSFGSWRRSGDELAMSSRSASDRDGPGTNRLSKIECVLGTGMSQNASRDRRLA